MPDDNQETEHTVPPNVSLSPPEDGNYMLTNGDIKRATFFNINEDNKPVGKAIIIRPPHDDQFLYVIHQLTINPENRNSNLGKRLLGEVEKWALQKAGDAVVIEAIIEPDNPNDKERLLKFYQNQGYELIERDISRVSKTIYKDFNNYL